MSGSLAQRNSGSVSVGSLPSFLKRGIISVAFRKLLRLPHTGKGSQGNLEGSVGEMNVLDAESG